MDGELLYLSNMTEAESNLEKYRTHLQETGYDKLRPMKNQPADENELMKRLGVEGLLLLEEDNKKSITDEKSKLDSTLGEKSSNPFVRARIEVLEKMTLSQRSRILKMEAENNLDNPIYQDFVKSQRILGDEFSA